MKEFFKVSELTTSKFIELQTVLTNVIAALSAEEILKAPCCNLQAKANAKKLYDQAAKVLLDLVGKLNQAEHSLKRRKTPCPDAVETVGVMKKYANTLHKVVSQVHSTAVAKVPFESLWQAIEPYTKKHDFLSICWPGSTRAESSRR